MSCRFKFPKMKGVSYLVEWYNGRSKIPVKKDSWCISDTKDDCSRRESTIRLPDHFVLGDTVRCRLFMKNSTKKTNKWTATGKDSFQYYVGIQVSPRHVIVKECNIGENITVTLRPTVPIVPIVDTPDADRILVSVLIPQEYKAQRRQAAVDKCHVELKTQDISNGKTITIKGICDNQQDQRESYSFHFKPQGTGTSWLDLEDYRMPSIKVTVDNTDTKVCLTTTDPNLFTFDDRKLFYNDLGDYVMYSNEGKKIQVHVRLWVCAGQMTCVCGAAIREGRNVIVISMCNKMRDSVPTILRTFKRSPGSLSKGIQITKKISGATMEQEVILSSGTRISVMRAGKSLDVRINAPATDKGRVSGLCGNFNGDPRDDLVNGGHGNRYASEKEQERDFASRWRLPAGKSFFEILPEQEEEEPEQGRSCYCAVEGEENQQENKCDDNTNIFTRIDSTQIEILTTQFNDKSQFEMKRSVDTPWYSDDIIDDVERSYYVDDPHVQQAINRIRTKRSPREVISKDEATKYCRSQIEASKAGGVCKEIATTNIKNAMLQCVNDLTLTGDKTFAALAFNTMKYICEDTTLKNLSFYTHTVSGELVPPRQVVEDLCPADCSGHGRCKNRTCICDEGFTALDCSMEVQAIPELLGIYNGGLCDIRERPCKKTNLLGQKFIDSKNLTCHVKELKVYSGSWSPRGIPFTTQGKMTDLFGVKCDLLDPRTKLDDYEHEGTPAGGLLISVSNDGFRASTRQLRHVTYDSKCMTCNKSGKCERKANSCLIRGHCFAAYEPNPRDWCGQCLPRDSHNSWTPRKDNQAPEFISGPTYKALQGEDLVLQLKAPDPDNRPVTYSLLNSTATGFTFSAAGLLRWKVTSNEKFTFKVIDECGAFDTTDVRVHIVQCPCLNGGQCVPHPYHPRGSGLYQCKCRDGTSGDRCEKVIVIAGEKVPNAAPTIRDITPVRYDTMRITWSPIPADQSNGIIRGYKIYYRQLYTKNKWDAFTTQSGDLNVAMVTGLRSYAEYCVKMSAFTSKGEYPDWEREPCKTVKTPSLPIKVSGQALSRTEIILRFQKPRHAPPSSRVQVDYGKYRNELNKKKVCYGSSCVLGNLEEDTMYYFKVIGYVYQRGESPAFTQIGTIPRGS